jgi:5-methyltetrahydropteroyltriglutamate--homocysteine methyltransferase
MTSTDKIQSITTHNLGFPRIGQNRELKKALEAYWRGEIKQNELEEIGRRLRKTHWQLQADAGLDLIPTGDFAWYDHVLTLSATLGNIPARHRNTNGEIDLDTLFRVARGHSCGHAICGASEMTKWFDTNYHHLVPEFYPGQTFSLSWTQIIDETAEAITLGYKVKPVILGPLSYLYLGKFVTENPVSENNIKKLELLNNLLVAYKQLLQSLADVDVEWVQIDEPILTLDLPDEWKQAFEFTYHRLKHSQLKILLATYFGGLGDNLSTVVNLPVAGLHIDAVRAPEQCLTVADRLSAHKVLSIGIVDGRNIWRNNFTKSINLLTIIQNKLIQSRQKDLIWIAPSCSLLHSPYDVNNETLLDTEQKSWLSFAKQKLEEIVTLKQIVTNDADTDWKKKFEDNNKAIQSRLSSTRIHNQEVKKRLISISENDFTRKSDFSIRKKIQQASLNLPLLPTTTIGSFPQTPDIRRIRAEFKSGIINLDKYNQGIQKEIADCIYRQEKLDIDVLVHGEAERNDMVEYFGEQLEGFLFTQNGWVQSYGSRCVKPPIIIGDVSRTKPITVDWTCYAQSLTHKPVKGMLTGPITILCWSFVRDDQPRSVTANQIALALRDEVLDLEAAGIRIIQIDEPAIREGLPLRKKEHKHYLNWAVNAFKLMACGVHDETQIHTHMCYSEFNEIIAAIADLDADVISIEASRSNGDLLKAFEDFNYPNAIGPGVYDIHSPNVPEIKTIIDLIKTAANYIPIERLWVNPDCGLKTRGWPETEAALVKMAEATKLLREEFLEETGKCLKTKVNTI